MLGTTIGRYRILEAIGRGGMGEVFLAEDPVLARKVAIKVLPREFALDGERRSRLLHEARAASALNHPSIITVHDLGESDGVLFMAVELIEGRTLRDWCDGARRSPVEVLRVLRQAAQALALAHQAGLVHRDLKPENLMVRRDGLLKILDFGLARSVSPDRFAATATIPGTIMGTAPYMSPEQVLGQPAGPPSDIFSLGTILYELLTGKHPFAADSPVETMHRILHETPAPPSRVNPALAVDFDFVLSKALSKDPKKRHSSMADLDVDLETLECGCGPSASPKKEEKDAPRTIAVLPFKNIGGDPAMSYLGVGLADAVITRLSTSPDLIVRSTSSIMPYENQSVDPRRVAQELDVASVLDASFQRMGDRFRATARLIEAMTGRTIWAGKVDLRLEDLFEVQDQVAHGIAEALVVREDAVATNPKKAYTPSGAEFERVMRGLEGMRRGTEEGVRFGIAQFEQATRAEPQYAHAWANLAFAYHAMVDGGFDSDPEWFRKSGEALARAQALDPGDAYVHFVAGAGHLVRGRKRDACRELRESLRLAPNVSQTYHYVEYLFRLCDMYEEAVAAGTKAVELEPYTPFPYGALVRIEAIQGHYDRAREWMELERRRIGSERVGRLDAIVLLTEGRYQEAYEAVSRGSDDLASIPSPAFGLIAQLAGKTEDAAAILERGRGHAEIDMDGAADMAGYMAQIGNKDEAFRLLGRATELGNDMLTHYERARWYEPLRSDPRWKPFIEGVRGRVEQYKREFRWPLL